MPQPAPSAAELALLDPDGSFRVRLIEDRERIAALAVDTPSKDQLAELSRLVHRLAGAAGTFGFPEISAAAIALDDALVDGAAAADARPMIANLLAALTAI